MPAVGLKEAQMSKFTQMELREALLRFVASVKTDVFLVGDAALKIGPKAALEEVEKGLDDLCVEGLLRELSDEEARKKDLKQGYVRCSRERGQTAEEKPAYSAPSYSGTRKTDT